jgi:GNAT superfamily N-acetyltransferase
MLRPVSPHRDRAALQELLDAYHGWMADHAGDAYDPAAELAEDLESTSDGDGRAWVVTSDGDPAGCVLLYGLSDSLAEFKRLWVMPGARGSGLGRALVEQTVETARREGYETLGLTTPPWATEAHALYESLGFERTPPYPETKLPERYHEEAIFMRRTLDDSEATGTERAG